MTRDHKRNGTTTLFAALNILTCVVLGTCLPRHRHGEFLQFLRLIDKQVPRGLAVHLIVDSYSTHKHETVRTWLAKHPRFHLHFTPTSSSWLNLVECRFGAICRFVLANCNYADHLALAARLHAYLRWRNRNARDPELLKVLRAEHRKLRSKRALRRAG